MGKTFLIYGADLEKARIKLKSLFLYSRHDERYKITRDSVYDLETQDRYCTIDANTLKTRGGRRWDRAYIDENISLEDLYSYILPSFSQRNNAAHSIKNCIEWYV